MGKNEFLYALRGRLAETLPREKVEEHVRYYDSYIAEKVSQGMTEEEVTEQLGDPLLIAKTIMDTSDVGMEQKIIYEEDDTSYNTRSQEGWDDGNSHFHQFHIQTRGGCLLAAIIFVVVAALILWMVGSVVSFLLPVLVPVMIVLLIVSYMKQR